MSNKKKIALFDFCGTLVNFQTADAYVVYVANTLDSKIIRFRTYIYIILLRSHFIGLLEKVFSRSSINKRLLLWTIKGLDMRVLDSLAKDYYNKIIKPNLIPETITLLRKLQGEGYDIYIISAGYSIYIKYFMSEYNVSAHHLIANIIKSKCGKCSGSFNNIDVLYSKVVELDRIFDKSRVYSIAVSDSISDLPMLRWADDAIVVSKNISQKWVKNNRFKELIWIL